MKHIFLILAVILLISCSSVNGPGKDYLVGNRYRYFVDRCINYDEQFPSPDRYMYGCWEVIDFYSEDSLLMFITNEDFDWQPIEGCCNNYSAEQKRVLPYWYEVNYPYITIEFNIARDEQQGIFRDSTLIVDDTTIFRYGKKFTKF